MNLVVALMATEQGLTKDTILTSVAGYREQSEAGASKDALEKMFERDKESLRGLGVPIETIGDWADPDDLREARYRVPTAEYELPEDIEFTPAEVALLTLAGGVWSQSSMSADARSGLRKIRALGIAVDEPIIGYSPRVSVREPAFPALKQAIEQARVASFRYLKPGEQAPSLRRLEPLALVEYEARWHVYGVDLDAAAHDDPPDDQQRNEPREDGQDAGEQRGEPLVEFLAHRHLCGGEIGTDVHFYHQSHFEMRYIGFLTREFPQKRKPGQSVWTAGIADWMKAYPSGATFYFIRDLPRRKSVQTAAPPSKRADNSLAGAESCARTKR